VSKRLIALIVGALAVGLIAGCGSSSDDSSTSSLTKAEFIKQGDVICTKHHETFENELRAFLKKSGANKGIESADALSEFAQTKLAPVFSSEAEELRALGAPSGEEEEVNAILDPLEEGIEELENNSAKLGKETPAGIEKANNSAEKFGFKVCVTN